MFGAEQRAAPEIVADEAGRNKLVHQGHVSRVHKVRHDAEGGRRLVGFLQGPEGVVGLYPTKKQAESHL